MMSAVTAMMTNHIVSGEHAAYIKEGLALGNRTAPIETGAEVIYGQQSGVNKVKLPAPKNRRSDSAMLVMLLLLAKMNEIKGQVKETTKAQLTEMKNEFSRLMEERIKTRNKEDEKRLEQIQEAKAQREKAEKGGFFSSVFNWVTAVADVVIGTASVVAGFATCQPNLVAGGAILVAAGGCAVAAEIGKYAGEKQAAMVLEMLAMSSSMLGGILISYGAGAARKSAEKAAKEAAEEAVEKAVRETTENAAKRLGIAFSEEAFEQAVKEGVQKHWDDIADTAILAAKASAKEAGEEIAEEALEKVAKEAMEKYMNSLSEFALGDFNKRLSYRIMKQNMKVVNVFQNVGNMLQSGITIDLAVSDYNIAKLIEHIEAIKAELKENKALLYKFEELIGRLMTFINELAASLTRAVKIVSDCVKDQGVTATSLARRAII